jgi:tRNA A-37 threonylcarbamoyl transferase component Bud32
MGPLRALAHRWSGRHLPVLSDDAHRRWLDGASELARDRQGCRTLRTADGAHVVKELALKRVLSSALWRPYALRFAENAAALRDRGVGAPDVVGAWRLPSQPLHLVVYRWRDGVELRDALRDPASDRASLLARLGAFLARLHDAGATFRSAHLGNFIVGSDDGTLSVIDCVDVAIAERPLSPETRSSDLAAVTWRDDELRDLLGGSPGSFLRGYFANVTMAEAERWRTWTLLPGDLNEQDVGYEDACALARPSS